MSQESYLDHTGGKRALELFGNRPEPQTTRERLIETAVDLFYTRGFHAVGLDQIIATVGVTKTTFYNHFESKDQLILEAIERRETWETLAFDQRVAELAGDDPREMMLAMFDVLDEWFTHPDFYGCLFLNACIEYPSPFDPIHKIGARHYELAREAVTRIAHAANDPDPEELAGMIVVLFQGTISHRQVTGDNLAARRSKAALKALLDQRLARGE